MCVRLFCIVTTKSKTTYEKIHPNVVELQTRASGKTVANRSSRQVGTVHN